MYMRVSDTPFQSCRDASETAFLCDVKARKEWNSPFAEANFPIESENGFHAILVFFFLISSNACNFPPPYF